MLAQYVAPPLTSDRSDCLSLERLVFPCTERNGFLIEDTELSWFLFPALTSVFTLVSAFGVFSLCKISLDRASLSP